MFKLNQKGAAHLLLIILLLAGLGVAVYLVGQTTNIIPKAYEPRSSMSAPVTPGPTPTPESTSNPFECTACAADIVKSSRNRVDAQDNALLSSCFGKSPSDTLSGGKSCAPADISQDGAINQTDVDCLKSVYFQSCTATPTPTPAPQAAKRVFVTFNQYTGNLGGLSGADTKCQGSANAANLGGVWKAWLSDSVTSAGSRLTHNNGPYKLLNGTIIANDWADLTDSSINHAINISEYKAKIDGWNVWTNTTRTGEINQDVSIQPAHCQNWTTSTSDGTKGAIGSTWSGSTNYNWTESGYDYCGPNQSKRLFCFEQ